MKFPNHDLIDAHCHLHSPWFTKDDYEIIIKEAKQNGITKIINCSSDPRSFGEVISSSQYGEIDITIGLQPTLADSIQNGNVIKDLLEEKIKIIAIGEIGLDYYWVKDDNLRKYQEILFVDCIKLANEYNLPLVIHSRKAEMECLTLLEKYAEVDVLLHSFEGNLEKIKKAKELEYIVSVPTNVVWRKNRKKVAMRMGLENIVLETDSPFCGPGPDIKVNTPKHILTAAIKLAELFEIDLEELAKITSTNAEQFYKI